MSVTTTQAVSLLENVLFESPAQAAANAQTWVSLSNSTPADSTVAGLASAMAASSEASIAEPVFRYYIAALGRTPAGSELAYYVQLVEAPLSAAQLAQGANAVSLGTWDSIATGFTHSAEFTAVYGTSSATETNVILSLYSHILSRTPSASELAYYQAQLTNGYSIATVVQEFANSPEYQANTNPLIAATLANHGVAIQTAAVTAPLALYNLSTDSQTSLTEGGTEVFTVKTTGVAAGTTLYYNLSGVPASDVVFGQTSGTATVGDDGKALITVTLSDPGGHDLSAGTLTASVSASQGGASLASASVSLTEKGLHSVITASGANETITLNGGNVALNLLGGTDTTIMNYVAGSGVGLHVMNTTSVEHASLLNLALPPQQGPSLNFNSGTSYAILTGSLGDGSTASVVQALNAAYTVAHVANEAITFYGQDNAGNTEIWFFGSTAGAVQGVIPASSLAPGADTNGNHLIDANEVTHIATLTGVKASSLTLADLV